MKEYRVAVIGSTGRGDYGHGIDTVWRDVPGTKIVAVADDNKAGLTRAAKRLGVEQAFADYREMLDKVKPDIVGIGPRWIDQRRDMIVAAAERGIHVFVDKPLCRTLAEADEIVAACERTHARLVIAFQTRYSPKLPVVKQLIDTGKIGRVLEYRGRGKEDARGGAEDLWVLGWHILDLIRALAGDAKWCFGSVSLGDRPIQKTDVREGNEGIGLLAGDRVAAMYGMSSGPPAYFNSEKDAAGRPSRFALQILGTKGVIEMGTNYLPAVKYLPDSSWSPGRSRVAWQNVSSQGVGQSEPVKDGHPHWGNVAAVKDLIAAIENHRQPKAGVYDARAALEMIVAVFASVVEDKPVALPLVKRDNPLGRLA